MLYPAYNQTVNETTMARLGSGVEVGMVRFGAVHTATDRNAVSRRYNVRCSGSLACKPVARNRSLRSLSGKLAMNDGATRRKLHRKPSVVLVVDDRARIVAKRRLAGDEITERVDVLAPDQALLDRLQQLDLPVGRDALPVVDDDRARARKGRLVDLASRIEHVRVGDGDDHLTRLEPVAAQHRLL